jgi:predicted nucleic acid-binding protein
VTAGTLVDSNVLLDVLTEDQHWSTWSADALAAAAETGPLVINQVIYAEVSIQFSHVEELDDVLPAHDFRRRGVPWPAAFLAGKAFLRYRRDGGERRSPLPDFFIGAHAAIEQLTLLTRDATRYRSYFPTVALVSPS